MYTARVQFILPFAPPLVAPSSAAACPPAEGRRGEAALGLSPSTNLYAPDEKQPCYMLEYRSGGQAVRIIPPPEITKAAAKFRGFGHGRGGTRGDRQAITAFTSKSRTALKRKFDCLHEKYTGRCHFTTLTYQQNTLDGEQAHKDLNAFGASLGRKFGDEVGFMWKMEQQKRGSIHFHLLIFGIKYMKKADWMEFSGWVAYTWARIVAHGGEISIAQIEAGTQIELAEKGHVRAYLEKYIAKVLSTDPGEELPEIESPGRFWGERYMKQFHAPKVEIPISNKQAVQLARILDNYRKAGIRQQWGKIELNAQTLRLNQLRASQGYKPVPTWSAKEGKQPPENALPLVKVWMLRWMKKRKKHVKEQRSYWQLGIGNCAERLLTHILN